MSRIPMQHRGKRPRLFADEGIDELMSMVLELTAETWIIKKRLYLLERVAGQAGVPLTPQIENYKLSEDEVNELDALRGQLITTVLRTLEADFAGRAQVHEEARVTGNDTFADSAVA